VAKQSAYSLKLKDPRWQKLRLEVLQRCEWKCQLCLNTKDTLFVHHNYYSSGRDPWDYPPEDLHAYCEDCHLAADAQRIEWQEVAGPFTFEEREGLIHVVNCFRAIKPTEGRSELMDQLCDFLNEHMRSLVSGTPSRLAIVQV
jgi:hypothetical protein